MSPHALFLIWRGALGFAFGWILSTRRVGLNTWQFWALAVVFALQTIQEGA